MADLTLPGSIPGLLRRGSPVRYTADGPRGKLDATGVITGYAPRTPGTHDIAWDGGTLSAHWPKEFSLDLSDATGRAHAAWYLGGDGCTWGRVADERDAGPIWLAAHAPESGVQVRRFCAVAPEESSVTKSYLEAPSLFGLDPLERRTLPDGSSFIDAEALRLVVLHVAGIAP